MMNVVANPIAGGHKTGELNDITVDEITRTLGFAPNVDDDAGKVVNSWGFTVDGHACGIWDYKGSHEIGMFSTFGPDYVFRALFSPYYSL
jgi:hypothetical protein